MILVTGASGHVGNVLVRELIARRQKVRALVLPGETCVSLEGLPIERVEGNVLDPASLQRAMQGVEIVYHLAGIISIVPGAEALMRRVNVEGVRNVARAALHAGVRRMVHVSSIHAFKRLPLGRTIDENTPLAPDSPAGAYDRTKAEGTLTLLEVVKEGLDAVIVCPTGVIGPYDFLQSEMGQTILGFARKKPHMLVDGAYDFVDVRDVAHGLILACEKGRRGEIYILSGSRVHLAQIRAIVQEIVGIQSELLILPRGLAKAAAALMNHIYRWTKTTPSFTTYALQTVSDNSCFSCQKARRELGYRPRPLHTTIADTLEWWKRRSQSQ